MADVEAILQLALSQRGKRYVFGAQPADSDPNPAAFDCSSLVRWACNRAGLSPAMATTSQYQEVQCRQSGTLIGIDEAMATRGTLLFNHRDPAGNPHVPSPPIDPGYYSHAHVAFSIGGGQTIEGRSTELGVIVATSAGRGWTAAARIPGATYGAPLPPPGPPGGFPAPRTDKPYLRRGASGPAVAEMQRLLIATGRAPELAAVGAGGNFLDITARSLRGVQGYVRSTYGDPRMVVDAECGPITWAWLYRLTGG